jgi:hypothetical protein
MPQFIDGAATISAHQGVLYVGSTPTMAGKLFPGSSSAISPATGRPDFLWTTGVGRPQVLRSRNGQVWMGFDGYDVIALRIGAAAYLPTACTGQANGTPCDAGAGYSGATCQDSICAPSMGTTATSLSVTLVRNASSGGTLTLSATVNSSGCSAAGTVHFYNKYGNRFTEGSLSGGSVTVTNEGFNENYREIVAIYEGSDQCAPSRSAMVLVGTARETFDFDNDGKSDILWRSGTDAVEMWLMNGTTATAQATLLGGGSGYFVKHAADFDGDGNDDILWESSAGATSMWLMNGLSHVGGADLLGGGTGWTVKHTGDFNGDGKADILWEHTTNGASSIWLMNGTAYAGGLDLIGPNSGWKVKFIGDFNGDGKRDLLWESAAGATSIWLMDGITYLGGADLNGPGTGWTVKQLGDFNGDGKTDIIWEHTDGTTTMWLMNGTTVTSGAGLVGPGTGYHVKWVNDFNGDGKDDLIWEHTDASVSMWLMDGVSNIGSAGLIGPASGYTIVKVRDLNGDGKADLIWQFTDGSTSAWLMNGTALLGSGNLRPGSDDVDPSP